MQAFAFDDWNLMMRVSLELYFRMTFVYAVAYIFQLAIILICLLNQINRNFLIFVSVQTLWLQLDQWTVYRLLKLKSIENKRHWRKQNTFTYTAKNATDGLAEDSSLRTLQQKSLKMKMSYKSKSNYIKKGQH